MKVLITGVAGFLGSHLADYYLSLGHEVTGIDNLSTGSLSNLNDAFKNSNFSFVEHDVIDPFFFESELILNFACPASPVHYQKTPIQTLLTSFLGTVNALNLAKQTGARMLHASTSEVYGDPEISPQTEEYSGKVNPIGPRACYDEGKRAAETAIFDYMRVHNLDVRVVRIFNTYGPRMAINDGRVVSNFIVSALTNRDITIYGDGSQTRSFCFVNDTISGIVQLAEIQTNPGSPINIGNPNEISMVGLASRILTICNSNSKLIREVLPQDDPKQRCPEISLAKRVLSWEPRVDLDDGLNRTRNYFESIL